MDDSRDNRHKGSSTLHDDAAAWVLKIDRGLTASEQDELSSWLAADPRHGTVLAQSRTDWKRLDKLGRWRPEHSSQPNPDLLAPPSPIRRWPFRATVMVGAAAAALVAAFVMFQSRDSADPVHHTSGVAENSVVIQRVLEDGTIVELNRGARLTVNFSAAERRVRLEDGEAYFSVSKDATRPFIVTAGEVDVRAIGTAFNVRMRQSGVDVLVAEGHVQLTALRSQILNGAESVFDGSGTVVAAVLKSKQQAVISFLPKPAPLKIATLSVGEIDAALAWQHRLLDFSALPLGEVVTEFNRRNHVQLILMDAELASIPISASFRSDNIDGFLRLLEAGFEARAERRGESEILLYRRR